MKPVALRAEEAAAEEGEVGKNPMNKKVLAIVFLTVVTFLFLFLFRNKSVTKFISQTDFTEDNMGGETSGESDLSIEVLRKGDYPGSDLVIEQTLSEGSNYDRYIVHPQSIPQQRDMSHIRTGLPGTVMSLSNLIIEDTEIQKGSLPVRMDRMAIRLTY